MRSARPPGPFLPEPEGDRLRRIESLQARIESGSYSVPAGAVADAVVAFYSRRLPQPRNPGSGDESC